MEHCNNRQHDLRCGTVRLIARISQAVNQADQNQSGTLFVPIAPSVWREPANKQRPAILPAGYIG